MTALAAVAGKAGSPTLAHSQFQMASQWALC
jgi:hypothetical protein